MSRTTRGAVTRMPRWHWPWDGGVRPIRRHDRRYPKWWMQGQRHCRPGFPKWLRTVWHRRGRRAEDAALRVVPDEHVTVYGRRKPGHWWEWY
jgi:hypothetical protein